MFKLMIVDDELLMRIGIRSMLEWEELGFRVIGEAANGREALEMAKHEAPDLIITDIKMPVMDGLELIREASRSLPACKYVILSNFDEFRYVKEALRLGALDYLIKSEITSSALTELLALVRQKLQSPGGSHTNLFAASNHYTESLVHLKESFFKDVISGLLAEEEALAKADQLQVQIKPEPLMLIKFRIDRFEEVKKKYVEKDEKLLRISILNILEELIPSRWDKEMIVESSAEYLVVKNVRHGDHTVEQAELKKLCAKINSLMLDFMNLTLSVGVSTVVHGYRLMKTAYREADLALRHRFYKGTGQVIFYEDVGGWSIDPSLGVQPKLKLDQEFQQTLECKDETRFEQWLSDFRIELETNRADEKHIREAYLFLLEFANSRLSYPVRSRFALDAISPYESVFTSETWDEIHRFLRDYVVQYWKVGGQLSEHRTYADMAAEIIHQYYAEDISLQSVANQINVNPSYLSRIFKLEKEENFVTYLTRVRIEKAKSLLDSRWLRVYEVADQVGYHNYTYFSKIFKKVVGLSPEEYRNIRMDPRPHK